MGFFEVIPNSGDFLTAANDALRQTRRTADAFLPKAVGKSIRSHSETLSKASQIASGVNALGSAFKAPKLGEDGLDPDRIRGLMQAGVGALGSAFGGKAKQISRFFSGAIFGGVASKGALIDIQTRERLEFQFNPETISDEQQTEWTSVRSQGMSHPRKQWAGGGDRVVSFTLRFYRDSFSESEVSQNIAWLQSLMLPEYDGNRLKDAPHRCLFVFGTLYNLTCILTRAGARYYDLFSPSTLQPVFADIDIELAQFVEIGEDYRTRRGNSGGSRLDNLILSE